MLVSRRARRSSRGVCRRWWRPAPVAGVKADSEKRRAAPAAAPIDLVLAPFRAFTRSSASSGVLLLAAAVVAMVAANSAWSTEWAELWETKLAVSVGTLDFSQTLLHWINDGLMAIFFLVVGLEIKREVLVGELASVRRAALPIAAAAGGAVLPAIIFLLIVGTGPESRGWGVPMATDIAFAIGALAILGSRVPSGLRVFLVALAIVDDLIAVLVIAIFYTSDLSVPALAAAGAILVGLVLMNALGVRHPLAYGLVGIALWLAVYESGIHATIAGVLLALTIPSRVRLDPAEFGRQARAVVDDYEGRVGQGAPTTEGQQAALWELEDATEKAQAPMNRIEHGLQPWAVFVIMPLFALANAGVTIRGELADMVVEPVFLGVVLGLIVGKQVGISLASFAIVRSGLARLPEGVGWRHIYGATWLAGIGFTMSLFIATLALEQGDAAYLGLERLGILAGSIVSGLLGYAFLRWTFARDRRSA
jgi:Na+:H+ antiporter, NhaA family